MYNEQYQYHNTPDSFDEFFLPFYLDIPNILPSLAPTPMYAPAPVPVPPTSVQVPAPFPDDLPTCRWVSQHDPARICGAPLSPEPRSACAHFRLAHNIRGNDKVTTGCHWYGCRAAPMQKGSVIRHVLAVHLGLLRWQCENCGRVFSRKGTSHVCGGGEHA